MFFLKSEDFKQWASNKITDRAIKDGVSRCRKIEKSLNVDLDEEYTRDGGQTIISRLVYSSDDERNGKPAPDGFSFKVDANIRFRMTDMRSAAKRYFKFCQETQKEQ